MAINIKMIFANALLELCEEKPLKKITILDLIKKTGASRATFYHHFRDKNELLTYIYQEEILKWDFGLNNDEIESRTEFCRRLLPYKNFLIQAFRINDQNSLSDAVFNHCRNWYIKEVEQLYGANSVPDEIYFSIDFISHGISRALIDWTLDGMIEPPETIAKKIGNALPLNLKDLYGSKDKII